MIRTVLCVVLLVVASSTLAWGLFDGWRGVLEEPTIPLAALKDANVDVYHYIDSIAEAHSCQKLPEYEGHYVCYANTPPIYALPYTRLPYGKLRKALLEGWMRKPTQHAVVLFLRSSHQVRIVDRTSREELLNDVRNFSV